MSSATLVRPVSVTYRTSPADFRGELLEDDSPFGLQGLTRETLQVPKPEKINALAALLAWSGTAEQIRDEEFVARVLARREDWLQEYRVIHLIERSLWIDGHSDLVMTLTKNPSQIPDNPPRQVVEALMLANRLHPQSTVWYGVPLFSDQANSHGLPIPLTAAEVRAEARRRVAAAQQHALRWGWAYRGALQAARSPAVLASSLQGGLRKIERGVQLCCDYWKRARRDARLRTRAMILAHSEYCRMGRSETIVPEHTTALGQMAMQTVETFRIAQDVLLEQASRFEGMAPLANGATPVVLEGLKLASLLPIMIPPLTLIACDPFLFVELPDEPNKLRHLGHWYWQTQPRGERKLHLHV